MKKYGKILFQNLKMADSAIEKSKKSLTQNNFSRDILEKVQELKLKISELEDIANKFEIGAAKENPPDSLENDNRDNIPVNSHDHFDTRNELKAQNRQLGRNLQEQKKKAKQEILESADRTKCDNMKTDKKLTKHKLLKCQVCEMEFEKFCDLEWHLKAKHEECTKFECDQCQKTFVTEWRLKKHTMIHSDKITKHCHYFINSIRCPFDELGCKFLHIISYNSVSKIADDSKNTKFSDTMENSMINGNDVDIKNMTNSIDISENGKRTTFLTSTPNKMLQSCEECLDEWESIDCLLINTLTKHGDMKKIFI